MRRGKPADEARDLRVARRLAVLHEELTACRACPDMHPPVVVGPPVPSRVLLVGQAPGAREGDLGRPFAWTAGKRLFGWLERAIGADEATVRARVYIAAVARCFPGKARSGGDRRPSPAEVERCQVHLAREVGLLEPRLVIAVGTLAIERVLGRARPLVDVVGPRLRARWLGADVDVVCLPHPSGASTWHRADPGKRLLEVALGSLAAHPEVRRVFA